jgi:MATE family multidrug resistance protein
MDPLCAQAYGARQYRLVGLYAQRAVCILTLACIPVMIIWSLTSSILISIGIEEEVAILAGEYVNWLMIGN